MTTKKNMYKRELITALQDWKTSTIRKPLLLRGARQVGKTTLVHHFAKKYTQYIYLNLEKKADAIHFIKYSDAQNILDTLLLANRLKPVSQATTLLFIDEIQELPDAIALLRYFYEDIPELLTLEITFKKIFINGMSPIEKKRIKLNKTIPPKIKISS